MQMLCREGRERSNQKFIEGEIGLTGPWQQQGTHHNKVKSQEANISHIFSAFHNLS